MKRKHLLIFAVGLAAGAALAFAGFGFSSGLTEIPAAESVGTSIKTTVAVPSAVSQASTPAVQPAQWQKDAVYTGGQEVLYQGKIFRAKWWTQGEEPMETEWGVWEYVRESNPVQPESTVPPESSAAPAPAVNAGTVAGDSFKVVAYYPSWKTGDLGKVDFSIVTHVNYAFAIPTPEGGLRPLENPELAQKLVAAAHASGRKVLLAVGGWSYNDVPLEPVFKSATETDAKLQKLGDAILAMCDQYQFDGIDMDWEHPRRDDSSKDQYQKLMVYLGGKLHAKGKLLTSAVLSGATADGNIYYDAAAHSDTVLNTVDWLNVMAYDGGDGDRHSLYEFAVNSANYWKTTRKLPAEKVVLGVPFYARPSWASYGDILTAVPKAADSDCVTYNGMQVWYNGVGTIQKKTAFAKQNLGGVMIWEITQDTGDKSKSLLQAIGQQIKK